MGVSYSFDDNGNELPREYKSVSWVNEYIKSMLEEEMLLQDIYVTGEISNFKNHSTGHLYFTLKDEKSEIKAIMFRTYAYKIKFRPEDGMKVIIHAKIGVYEKAGSYQLYVDFMQPQGLGNLYLAYEQLKNKLLNEGLFDESHKKPIPKFPNVIGIITSPTGAAVRDIIKVCKRRSKSTKLVLFPSAVQGDGAEKDLINGIKFFNDSYKVDVIIIGRGGGSIEDLWAFNDENLAREIYKSKIPVISAVGHEVDYTICDFVSDLRAATPSHAAELATPDLLLIKQTLSKDQSYLYKSILNYLKNKREEIDSFSDNKYFKDPSIMVTDRRVTLLDYHNEISKHITDKISLCRQDIKRQSSTLNALSPLAVLSRGYSVVKNREGQYIKSVKNVNVGDTLKIKLSDGQIDSIVTELQEEV